MKNIFNVFSKLNKEIEEESRGYEDFICYIYLHLHREANQNTVRYTNSGYYLELSQEMLE